MAYLLHQLLSESAKKYPERDAVIYNSEKITYAELESDTNKIASCLHNAGVTREDRVGIYLNKNIFAVKSILGILKAGAVYVPIDPLSPPERMEYIINRCGIKTLITSVNKLFGIKSAFEMNCPLETVVLMDFNAEIDTGSYLLKVIDWQNEDPEAKYNCEDSIDTDLAYILFTSGSTGLPKGVMLSHRNSLAFVNSAYDYFRIKREDRISNHAPLHFDLSIFDIFVALKAGASVVIVPENVSIFPAKLAQYISEKNITVWNSVPSVLSMLVNYKNVKEHDFKNLRMVLFAGEVFPIKNLRLLQELVPHASLYNMYGQTEANSSTCFHIKNIPADSEGLKMIGCSMPNYDVFALDEDGRKIMNAGETGELYVRSTAVGAGYWGDNELTDKSFVPDPLNIENSERVYKTGDLVRIDPTGNYEFLGRKDHMIKSRGYRIEIGEIENVISSHSMIKNAVVVPIPDNLIGNRIASIVVPSSGEYPTKENIIRHCLKKLPKYMLPEVIEFRKYLPETSTGKIDRKKVSAEFINEMQS
jgi:amino acid adenylation domain-containing protein